MNNSRQYLCAPEESDKPWQLPSLNCLHCVHLKVLKSVAIQLVQSQSSDQIELMVRLMKVFAMSANPFFGGGGYKNMVKTYKVHI